MLGKLMKYEFKATARIFLPLFGAMLAMAAITKLMFSLQLETLKIFSMVLSILLMVAAFVVTLILTIQRFHKNLLTSEGYLMLTLPVGPGKLISAKLLTAVFWTIVCTGAVFLALTIMAFSGDEWRAMIRAIRDIGIPSADQTFFIIEFIALILASLVTGILAIYASMALSMVSNKHRVALSIAFYIGLTTVMQILTSIVFSLFLIPNTNMRSLLIDSNTVMDSRDFFSSGILPTLHLYAGVMLVLTIGFGVAMFYTTRYMLKRQLNLQ